MKRKTIAALLAPVLFLILLAGCTTHGVASCNGDLGRCYVQESQQPTGVGVFIKGPGSFCSWLRLPTPESTISDCFLIGANPTNFTTTLTPVRWY